MISTRGRYAIRVMIDLAEHENGTWIPLKDIAARQGISKKYLEIIVKDMVSGGLLTGASPDRILQSLNSDYHLNSYVDKLTSCLTQLMETVRSLF